MAETDLFPKLDAAYQAAREYLTQKEEGSLAAFEEAVAALRLPKAQIIAWVREHAEWLHNIGKVDLEGLAKYRAAMEPVALGHMSRSLAHLEAAFHPKTAAGDPARLEKIQAALRFERAKGV